MYKKVSTSIYLTVFFLFSNAAVFSQNSPKWTHFDSEIFSRSKKEHKLVLLHLRANWCHWCHVMEEKTYTNATVLSYLEKNYITCMEDHDERQDLTSIYSEYGWPATIIFDENGNELFKEAGYIPADEFLANLTELKNNPVPLSASNAESEIKLTPDEAIKQNSIKTLKTMFEKSLDIEGGGFGFGQKYIEFATFEYALTNFRKDSTLKKWLSSSVVNSTGIFDKEWGGVFQYSTNNDWNHVHFEKLLAIQARYIKIYCWYYKLFNDPEALRKAESISKYVDRFLTQPQGGFYNAQDADLIAGEKSSAYFALSDAERIKKGTPPVDKNVYTSENAEYAEALTILWATTGKQNYLNKAIECVEFLKQKRKVKNTYKHGETYSSTISLKDNLGMLKTLILLYRATQLEKYKTEAEQLVKEISNTFDSKKGYFYTYVGNSAIKAPYNVTENIEACRLLNYCSHFFHEPEYKKTASGLLDFLTSEKLVNSISTEPGILSAAEELSYEPTNAALLIKKGEDLKAAFLTSSIAFPCFYFNSSVYTKDNIIEDKKDLFEAFDENFIVLCTSSYCSSPLVNQKTFVEFLYKRVLEK